MLIRQSESLRRVDVNARLPCTCGNTSVKVLRVLCVHFDSVFYLALLNIQLLMHYSPPISGYLYL